MSNNKLNCFQKCFVNNCNFMCMGLVSLQALLGTVCWGFVFGIVSAFSPNYYTLLLLRGLVGFGFGGGFLG